MIAESVDKSVDRVDKSVWRESKNDYSSSRGRIGIFVKAPLPGKVKTRLCPPLSAEEAAAFYAVSLAETVDRLARGSYAVTLLVDGDEEWFTGKFPRQPQLSQGEGNLGVRMERALCTLLSGGGPVLLVGSDSPDLPLALLDEAFAALAAADAVAAPARDGGYVLIGLRRPVEGLFQDIPWSTAEVLAVSRERARVLGIGWREVGPWEDVDDLASLRRLVARSPDSASARFASRELARHLGPAGD